MSTPKALVAVVSPRGALVHLHIPGYQITGKRRSDSVDTALCGQPANEQVPPPVGPIPTGRKHVPVTDVVRAMNAPLDPLFHPYRLRWCALCLGRAVEAFGITDDVAAQVVARANGEATA